MLIHSYLSLLNHFGLIGPGLKSGIGVWKLISTLKKKSKGGWVGGCVIYQAFPQNACLWEKSTTTTHNSQGAFVHSHLRSLCHCGLIIAWRVELVHRSWSPFRERKKCRWWMIHQTFPSKCLHARIKPPPPEFSYWWNWRGGDGVYLLIVSQQVGKLPLLFFSFQLSSAQDCQVLYDLADRAAIGSVDDTLVLILYQLTWILSM